MTQTDPMASSEVQSNDREEVHILGQDLVGKVKEVIHAGNVRRIVVKHEGRTIIEMPLIVGVVRTLLAPELAALGAIGALVTQCTLEVVRTDQS